MTDREAIEILQGIKRRCKAQSTIDIVEYSIQALQEREERSKGCVIALPCKIGDTIWQLRFEDRYPYPYRVDGTDGENMLVFQNENEWNVSPYPRGINIKKIPLVEWGKTVFLTENEANAASGRPLKTDIPEEEV